MRGTPFSFEGFTGGINTIADPYQLDQSEAREAMNVVSTQRGSIRKRYGSTLFSEEAGTPSVELNTLFACRFPEFDALIAAGEGKIYSIDVAGKVAQIGTGLSSNRWSIVQAPGSKEVAGQGPIYMTNSIDSPRYWTGEGEVKAWTGANEVTIGETKVPCYEDPIAKEHVPNGKYSIFAGNRIWMAGIKTDTSAVWFSEDVSIGEGGEQADPSFWPKTNVVRFDSSDGKAITGLGVVGPYILVFKEHKTWVIHNLNTGENRKLADTIGCVSHRSIVETAHGTFFLTADQGVYLTNGSSLTEVSYNVRPTLQEMNSKQREYAAGAYFANHYYLSYASGTSEKPNRTLDYDAQLKSWWPHDLAGNQWVVWESSVPGHLSLYTIPPKAKAGVVKAFVEGVYTDSGANYTGNGELGAFWLSSWDPFGFYIQRHRLKAPFVKKRVRQVHFDGQGEIIPMLFRNFHEGGRQEKAVVGNLEISTEGKVPIDFAASSEKFGEGSGFFGEGEGIFGGEQIVSDARIYAAGVARVWSVGWGNNSEAGFTIDAYMMAVSFRKS